KRSPSCQPSTWQTPPTKFRLRSSAFCHCGERCRERKSSVGWEGGQGTRGRGDRGIRGYAFLVPLSPCPPFPLSSSLWRASASDDLLGGERGVRRSVFRVEGDNEQDAAVGADDHGLAQKIERGSLSLSVKSGFQIQIGLDRSVLI